jgi:hypothetical protein
MAQSVLYGILEELRSQIQALALPGIPSANVLIGTVPGVEIIRMANDSTRYPCVMIAPYGAETITTASNLRDDVGYPILVAACDSLRNDIEQAGDKQTDRLDTRLFWRQSIRTALSSQRLTASVGMKITVKPLPIVDVGAFQRDLWISAFTLQIDNRESRT